MKLCTMLLLWMLFAIIDCLHLQAKDSPAWQALVRTPKHQHVDAAPGCARCGARRAEAEASLSDQQITNLRLELIKQQILQKLRLSEPPNVTLPQDVLPRLLINPAILQQATTLEKHSPAPTNVDDFYGKTEQVILFPKGETELCGPMSACFVLELPHELRTGAQDEQLEVNGATLWLYVNAPNTTLQVSLQNGGPPLAAMKTPQESGWTKLMLPHAAVAHCLHEHEDYMVLRVAWNSTEGKAPIALHSQHRPFLSISTRTRRAGRRRSRRNVNCTPGVKECCREKLYVSFRDIGWSDWFLQPKGYDAYFCRGSCTSAVSITQSSSFYTSVLQRYVHQQQTRIQPRRQVDLAPCCAPTKLAPLQVFYLDSNMAIIQKTLPNMVVEACGCL